jgi:hypothetical protein
MNQSKTGLNESFYKWIDDIRRAKRKKYELQEKLDFYNMKLIGYKGVSYDYTGSSVIDSKGDEALLYWLDKINQVQDLIDKNDQTIDSYMKFESSLGSELEIVLDVLVERTSVQARLDELAMKRSSYNQKKEEIIRLWMNTFL